MQIKKAKAAVLAKSREPLIVDEIDLPEALGVGQVLVKILYTTICGAQLNEIAAAKGPDKFLPHLLGHEASATVLEIGPGVSNVKPGDTVVLHWRPSLGIQCTPPSYRWRGEKLNAGWVTTFNELCGRFRKPHDCRFRRTMILRLRRCSAAPSRPRPASSTTMPK